MELPDDVLRIIRDFSRPVFRYFREYNDSIRILGIKEWPQLKENLTDEVLQALLSYVTAFTNRKTNERDQFIRYSSYKDAITYEQQFERERIYHLIRDSMRIERTTFRLLTKLIYGEEKDLWQLKLDPNYLDS
jgi:hypothetical protein